MKDPDFQGFWEALPLVAVAARRPGVAEAFRQQYREEIVTALMQLHRIGLCSGTAELHPAPPEQCDSCGTELTRYSCFVDGLTSEGPWASMCPICFYKHGHSIGWGTGQLYLHLGESDWRMIGGANPEDRGEGVTDDQE